MGPVTTWVGWGPPPGGLKQEPFTPPPPTAAPGHQRFVTARFPRRDVKRAKGGGEEEWVYSSLELFSFAKDHPAAAAEEGGEDDDEVPLPAVWPAEAGGRLFF